MRGTLLAACLTFSLGAQAAGISDLCDPSKVDAVEPVLHARAAGLSRPVLRAALDAYRRVACDGRTARARLAVIDYSRPSGQRRLWVFDLARSELLFHEWVAHGQGSGDDLARRFSNVPGSLASSLGVFVTGETYFGKHGLSLTLDGLDPGLNDAARSRAVVIHGADYVSDAFLQGHGRLGRSWGCPAVSRAVADAVIESLKDGAVLVAWYPNPEALKRSRYLGR